MTEREQRAMRAKGTAFECLYWTIKAEPQLTAEEIVNKARIKAHNDRNNARRKLNNLNADNKQKAKWTI